MPTLVRFLTVVFFLAVIAGALVFYLAFMVGPNTREMTIRIPSNKLMPQEQAQELEPMPPANVPVETATEPAE